MSTTAAPMSLYAPSPSYVPRTLSRPNSPALPPKPQTNGHYGHARSSSTSRLESPSTIPRATMVSPGLGAAPTPRLGHMERSSSGLRHEVKGEEKGVKDQAAQAILKILSSLPAPLPENLPPTFLPTPSTSPVSATSSPPRTFGEYARSSLKRNKRKRPTDSSDSSSDEPPSAGVGLGLGLSMSPESKKRPKGDSGPESIRRSSSFGNGRALTPNGLPTPSPAMQSKKLGGSGLRNEVIEKEKEEGKENWSKEKWREMALAYKGRALLLKRHGDAYQRAPNAHPQFVSQLPYDQLKGLLCHTDAVLFWLYSYFCDEQGGHRIRSSPYYESAPFREFVRKGWEYEMRRVLEEDDGRKEMAQAMVGLMHLIEAVIGYHLHSQFLVHLNRRGKELASSSTLNAHGPSPGSTTSNSPPGSALPPSSQPHPSPAARSSSSSSHHSPESQGSYSLPSDLLPLISDSTSSSTKVHQSLLTSRHHLTLRLLRTYFPKTFEYALTSELNDEALPVPGDNLGSAKRVDVDHPEKFAWPIELGMCAPVAHTVAFGRCLVEEMAENIGIVWERKLE
ncbi:uncharacterized protein IL334_006977 [Kwoniella shivajii]|uniref:Uncharacterized protein n=1 Tax=Kwoniella shivajii TaxID=564305 RepID=A0ABZ1D7F5_9TREE|nr:hypothetical protein IL334_006977 [Kwoniella shivajii]